MTRLRPVPDPSPPISRRWLYIPWAIAAALLVAYFMLWRTGAIAIERGVTEWIETQREAGIAVSHDGIRRDGFPFFLRVHIDSPEIIVPDKAQWRAETLSIDALPYQLDRLIFSPRGAQFASSRQTGNWTFVADDFRIAIKRDRKRQWVLSLTLENVVATRPRDRANARIGSMKSDFGPDPGDLQSLVASAEISDISIPTQTAPIEIDHIQTVFGATQTHLLSTEPEALDAWRNAGGAIIINGFAAEYEGGALSIAGTLGVDAENYPSGSLKSQLLNPATLTAMLAKLGILTEQEATNAGAGLSLAAIASGGKLSAPIVLEGGHASIHTIKVSALPKIK